MKSSLCIMLVTTTAMALAAAETVNFDNMKGGPPPGWTATQTGSGTAKWSVEKDNSAPSKPNVLKQSGQATFPVCFKNDTNIKDGFVEVKFKPISGKEDQAQRARKQRYDLPHHQRQAHREKAHQNAGRVRHVAHITCGFQWQSFHCHVRREASVRCRGHDVHRSWQSRRLDEG